MHDLNDLIDPASGWVSAIRPWMPSRSNWTKKQQIIQIRNAIMFALKEHEVCDRPKTAAYLMLKGALKILKP